MHTFKVSKRTTDRVAPKHAWQLRWWGQESQQHHLPPHSCQPLSQEHTLSLTVGNNNRSESESPVSDVHFHSQLHCFPASDVLSCVEAIPYNLFSSSSEGGSGIITTSLLCLLPTVVCCTGELFWDTLTYSFWLHESRQGKCGRGRGLKVNKKDSLQ